MGAGSGLAGGAPTDGTSAATIDTASAIVALNGDPLATYVKTKPAPGKKIDFSSNQVKSYRAQLNALRNDFKQWLRKNASDAQVTGEFDITLNAVAVQLNGTALSMLQAAPMVERAEYQGLYSPAEHGFDPDLTLFDAFDAWGGASHAAGAATAGLGVKVAIIDTGIDTRHPCFGSGTTNGGTNVKVLDAAVYYNKNGVAGFSPADANGHGTHVAGTVACNFNIAINMDGVVVPYGMSGVAPAAKLGNFNVFPGGVGNARSEDIMNALEDAFEKGYDVANMSLGGGSSGIQDLLSMATDNADLGGMVVAVAAGNEGPGFNSISSPGLAPRALTAGAVTVGHFIGVTVTDNTETVDYAASVGQFGPTAAVTGTLAVVASNGCSPLAALPSNSIALIARGTCSFSTKIRNAQTAGAVGTIIRNSVPGPPISMAQDGTPGQPTIPGVMVTQADGVTLTGKGGNSFTIDDALAYVYSAAGDNVLAGFSNHGPTDVDFRIKPDVVAPGVNVLSSQPIGTCTTAPCWAFFQGTSMATPHLAGLAALVKSKHSAWSSAQIRSAIVNTASAGTNLAGFTAGGTANSIGAGLANSEAAVGASVALDPVSVSFGAVPSGSGQSDSRTIAVSSLAGSAATVEVAGETCSGVDFGASYSAGTITVTMTAGKGIAAGSCQGRLNVMNAGGAEIAHAMIYALIK